MNHSDCHHASDMVHEFMAGLENWEEAKTMYEQRWVTL